jgi:hypothetical protein
LGPILDPSINLGLPRVAHFSKTKKPELLFMSNFRPNLELKHVTNIFEQLSTPEVVQWWGKNVGLEFDHAKLCNRTEAQMLLGAHKKKKST